MSAAEQAQEIVRKHLAEEATEAFLLWLDNDSLRSGSTLKEAQYYRDRAPQADSVLLGDWTAEQAEVFAFADALKDRTERSHPVDDAEGLVAALIRPTLERIDWNDVARHYLTKLDEGATP